MSDPTQRDDDFRGSRETKRQDETVMLNADSMSDLVGQARTGASAPKGPAPDAAPRSGLNLVLLVGGAVVLALIVIALVVSFVS